MSTYKSINEQSYSIDSELLVRLSAITKGELLERRKDIRRSLVLAALDNYNINEIVNSEELTIQIKQITKCKLIPEDIITVLNELENNGTIEHLGQLKYKLKIKPSIPNFEQIVQPVWNEFQVFLKDFISEYDPELHNNAERIFESLLMKILTRFSVSELLENQLDTVPIENFEYIISKEVDTVFFHDNFGKKYPDVLFKYFCSNSPKLLDFIFESYYGLINIDLVSREQELPLIDFCDEIEFLLLDTNFIIPLICNTDPKNPLSFALVKQCKKYNIPLYFTQKTKEEIWRSIKNAKSDMKGLHSRKGSITNNQIVADFINSKKRWSEYSIYLDSWEIIIKDKWNIVQIHPEMSANIDEYIYGDIKGILPIADRFRFESRAERDVDYHFHLRNENAYEHDAYCIGLIGYLKKNPSTVNKPKTLGPWFLTYDNLISFVNATYIRKDDEFGYVIQPRALLNYFLAYSKIQFDVEDKETVAIALLRFTARSKGSKLTIEEYSRLVSIKIDFGEENSEIIKEIFLKSPLLEELEKVLYLEDGEEADLVAYDIFSHPGIQDLIKEATYSKKDKEQNQQTIERLKNALKRERDELSKEKERVKRLEIDMKSSQMVAQTSVINNIYGERSKINIDSQDNSISFTEINNEIIFDDLRAIIEKSIPDINKKMELEEQIEEMKNTRKTDKFKESYKNFISSASDHMALIAPFIPTLASFL